MTKQPANPPAAGRFADLKAGADDALKTIAKIVFIFLFVMVLAVVLYLLSPIVPLGAREGIVGLFGKDIVTSVAQILPQLLPSHTPTVPPTPTVTPTPSRQTVIRHAGSCKFGTFEQDLVNGVGIYVGQEDQFFFNLQEGIALDSGDELNSATFGAILDQHKSALEPLGYVRWESSGQYRIRVFLTGSDVTQDENKYTAFLCGLAAIDIPTIEFATPTATGSPH